MDIQRPRSFPDHLCACPSHGRGVHFTAGTACGDNDNTDGGWRLLVLLLWHLWYAYFFSTFEKVLIPLTHKTHIVGRDLLRMVGADRFIPTSHRYHRHRDYHMPAMEYDIHEQQWEMSPYNYNNNQLDV
ncbi:hypothetical protein NQZ79_g5954 [Umbelopsis isabellina]|nr:hypothetical protein NQZ79_g5954 [Umbelopsis isabellina]